MRPLSCLYAFLASASPLLALELSDNVIQPPPPLLAQGILNAGVETAGSTTDGQFSVMQPLWSSVGDKGLLAGTLVFAEPYATWIERGAVDAGLGLGVRHLFGSQPVSSLSDTSTHIAGFFEEGWYVGANLSADMLQTSNNVRYWQMTPGVEIGTRYLEWRGHYQLPLTDGATTHVSDTTVFHNATDTYIDGNHLIGNRTTTVRRHFDVLHESLEGWDMETAALVPWLDQYMDLKLVGGYSRFHSTSLDAIHYDSWKTGAELRPFPACVMSATWYANEHMVGAHWMYGIRLELPFETANIGDGNGGFWGHIKAAFKPRRRHLAERLSESAHTHQLEPQIASYVTKSTTQAQSQFRGALILPDGTVLSVRSDTIFDVPHKGASSTSTSAASSANYGLVWFSSATYTSNSTYDGFNNFTLPPDNTGTAPVTPVPPTPPPSTP